MCSNLYVIVHGWTDRSVKTMSGTSNCRNKNNSTLAQKLYSLNGWEYSLSGWEILGQEGKSVEWNCVRVSNLEVNVVMHDLNGSSISLNNTVILGWIDFTLFCILNCDHKKTQKLKKFIFLFIYRITFSNFNKLFILGFQHSLLWAFRRLWTWYTIHCSQTTLKQIQIGWYYWVPFPIKVYKHKNVKTILSEINMTHIKKKNRVHEL